MTDRRLNVAWLAEWFGGVDEIPKACEVCDSGKPVVAIAGGPEILGACEDCALGSEAIQTALRRFCGRHADFVSMGRDLERMAGEDYP